MRLALFVAAVAAAAAHRPGHRRSHSMAPWQLERAYHPKCCSCVLANIDLDPVWPSVCKVDAQKVWHGTESCSDACKRARAGLSDLPSTADPVGQLRRQPYGCGAIEMLQDPWRFLPRCSQAHWGRIAFFTEEGKNAGLPFVWLPDAAPAPAWFRFAQEPMDLWVIDFDMTLSSVHVQNWVSKSAQEWQTWRKAEPTKYTATDHPIYDPDGGLRQAVKGEKGNDICAVFFFDCATQQITWNGEKYETQMKLSDQEYKEIKESPEGKRLSALKKAYADPPRFRDEHGDSGAVKIAGTLATNFMVTDDEGSPAYAAAIRQAVVDRIFGGEARTKALMKALKAARDQRGPHGGVHSVVVSDGHFPEVLEALQLACVGGDKDERGCLIDRFDAVICKANVRPIGGSLYGRTQAALTNAGVNADPEITNKNTFLQHFLDELGGNSLVFDDTEGNLPAPAAGRHVTDPDALPAMMQAALDARGA